RRFTDRTTHEIRIGDQPQDRQGAWPHHPSGAAAAGGSGHRVMDRRAFFAVGVGALAGSVVAESARADRIPRVGILGGGPSPSWEAFRRGLRERGYVEGRTIVLEYQWHGGNVDRSAALVAELAQRKVDVIVATSVPVIRAAQQAAPTIPIVMAASFDAV